MPFWQNKHAISYLNCFEPPTTFIWWFHFICVQRKRDDEIWGQTSTKGMCHRERSVANQVNWLPAQSAGHKIPWIATSIQKQTPLAFRLLNTLAMTLVFNKLKEKEK